MSSKRGSSISIFFGIILLISGVAIAGNSAYNLIFADQVIGTKQQKAAEVEPLVISAETTLDSDLAIGEIFAKLYVPRFGEDYVRSIAEGTSLTKVLNTIGLGRYLSTQMPGQVGNFAIAGHRSGNGGPMRDIDKFQVGDLVYVQTSTTWFTYKYLESKIVKPEQVGVINSVPEGLSSATPTAKYLTMTTCTPIYINTDRYIAWFEQISETPITAGVPAGLRK